jgi:hypothetical protein
MLDKWHGETRLLLCTNHPAGPGELRVVTPAQNRANAGPCGGASQFVGVRRHGDKWQAGIQYRGKYYYVGLFDDEVEAAKARDRKAWELHGEHAYLNFPKDFRR